MPSMTQIVAEQRQRSRSAVKGSDAAIRSMMLAGAAGGELGAAATMDSWAGNASTVNYVAPIANSMTYSAASLTNNR